MADHEIIPGQTDLGTIGNDDSIFVKGGSAIIDGDVDNSGLDNVAVVDIGAHFNGQFGTKDAPFKAKIGTRFDYKASGGDAHFASLGAITNVTSHVLIRGSGHFNFIEAGTITQGDIRSGGFTIADACTVTGLRSAGGLTRYKGKAGSAATKVLVVGGSLEMERGATLLTHTFGSTIINAATNAFAEIVVNGPGLQIIDCGTITYLQILSAMPDFSRFNKPVEITDCDINMSLNGAQEFLNNPLFDFSNTPFRFLGL